MACDLALAQGLQLVGRELEGLVVGLDVLADLVADRDAGGVRELRHAVGQHGIDKRHQHRGRHFLGRLAALALALQAQCARVAQAEQPVGQRLEVEAFRGDALAHALAGINRHDQQVVVALEVRAAPGVEALLLQVAQYLEPALVHLTLGRRCGRHAPQLAGYAAEVLGGRVVAEAWRLGGAREALQPRQEAALQLGHVEAAEGAGESVLGADAFAHQLPELEVDRTQVLVGAAEVHEAVGHQVIQLRVLVERRQVLGQEGLQVKLEALRHQAAQVAEGGRLELWVRAQSPLGRGFIKPLGAAFREPGHQQALGRFVGLHGMEHLMAGDLGQAGVRQHRHADHVPLGAVKARGPLRHVKQQPLLREAQIAGQLGEDHEIERHTRLTEVGLAVFGLNRLQPAGQNVGAEFFLQAAREGD